MAMRYCNVSWLNDTKCCRSETCRRWHWSWRSFRGQLQRNLGHGLWRWLQQRWRRCCVSPAWLRVKASFISTQSIELACLYTTYLTYALSQQTVEHRQHTTATLLRCCLHLPAAVTETYCTNFFDSISFWTVHSSASFISMSLRCPL